MEDNSSNVNIDLNDSNDIADRIDGDMQVWESMAHPSALFYHKPVVNNDVLQIHVVF